MIVIDTETTGTDWRYHGLISIGAIDFDNPENEFYGECRVFDGAHIDFEALKINRFTKEQIHDSDSKNERQLIEEFLKWTDGVGDITFAGENPSFDRDFIKAVFMRNGMNWPFAYRTIDIHSIAYAHMLKKGIAPYSKNRHSDLNLPKIIAYCGLPDNPKAHDAHDDALFEAEVLSRLIYGQSIIDELSRYPIPDYLKMA